jgi:hypothetical protein
MIRDLFTDCPGREPGYDNSRSNLVLGSACRSSSVVEVENQEVTELGGV